DRQGGPPSGNERLTTSTSSSRPVRPTNGTDACACAMQSHEPQESDESKHSRRGSKGRESQNTASLFSRSGFYLTLPAFLARVAVRDSPPSARAIARRGLDRCSHRRRNGQPLRLRRAGASSTAKRRRRTAARSEPSMIRASR